MGAGGGRRSRRRARGAAQPVGRSADARPRSRLRRGRWNAPRASRPRAIAYKRALAEEGRTPTRRSRPRTAACRFAPRPSWRAAARSVPIRRRGRGACRPARRCRSEASRLGALAWHDSSNDWHANQVVGSNVLAKSGDGDRARPAAACWAAAAEASLLIGADARYATEAGVDSNGVDQLFGRRRLSLRRAGRRRREPRGSYVHVNMPATSTSSGTRRPSPCTKAGR